MAEFIYNQARLNLIKQRQWKDRWGSEYVPAIFAVPKEAPGISTGTIIRARKLDYRECHVLSENERAAVLLGLHHPGCWELWDQKIMYPTPRPHFLDGHYGAAGEQLKHFRGTLDVAERLDMLSRHPKVRLKIGDDPHKWPLCPAFYISDLILFMRDAAGIYVLNWPVKDKLEDFKRRAHKTSRRLPEDIDDRQVARTLLEETYYQDAGIRTQEVAGCEINRDVYYNLREVFAADAIPLTIEGEQRSAIVSLFESSIGKDVPGYVLVRDVARRSHIDDREALVILRQAIWRRELRIDLFRPFLLDKPLHPERIDVLSHYRAWFRR